MEQSQEDGIQIGLRRGRKEGREEGMKEGIQQGVLSVAKELKEQGVPIEITEKSTHLSP
ncbi:MAG: hypothetical protein MJZ34_15970 [Paludibacteraceae bacterium]|nr:hypothetical protein [Paludibacteraceae bacterium]